VVPPLGEVPPEELIGDPGMRRPTVSAYEHGDEFDLVHDHTGPVGASIGAMSDWPTVHTLHRPFTEQTSMLYRRIARRHWFLVISQSQQSMGARTCAGPGGLQRHPDGRLSVLGDKDDYLLFRMCR
jgi:hypothetical protein